MIRNPHIKINRIQKETKKYRAAAASGEQREKEREQGLLRERNNVSDDGSAAITTIGGIEPTRRYDDVDDIYDIENWSSAYGRIACTLSFNLDSIPATVHDEHDGHLICFFAKQCMKNQGDNDDDDDSEKNVLDYGKQNQVGKIGKIQNKCGKIDNVALLETHAQKDHTVVCNKNADGYNYYYFFSPLYFGESPVACLVVPNTKNNDDQDNEEEKAADNDGGTIMEIYTFKRKYDGQPFAEMRGYFGERIYSHGVFRQNSKTGEYCLFHYEQPTPKTTYKESQQHQQHDCQQQQQHQQQQNDQNHEQLYELHQVLQNESRQYRGGGGSTTSDVKQQYLSISDCSNDNGDCNDTQQTWQQQKQEQQKQQIKENDLLEKKQHHLIHQQVLSKIPSLVSNSNSNISTKSENNNIKGKTYSNSSLGIIQWLFWTFLCPMDSPSNCGGGGGGDERGGVVVGGGGGGGDYYIEFYKPNNPNIPIVWIKNARDKTGRMNMSMTLREGCDLMEAICVWCALYIARIGDIV